MRVALLTGRALSNLRCSVRPAARVVTAVFDRPFNRDRVKKDSGHPASFSEFVIADGKVCRVAASSAWAALIKPYVGYRVVYAVETCAPQDGSSRKRSSNVWDALCRYGSGKCSLNNGMILSASRQETDRRVRSWTRTI